MKLFMQSRIYEVEDNRLALAVLSKQNMNYLGIDVSKDKLDVFICGQRGQFMNDSNGFKALVSWLKKKKLFNEIHACLESTGHYGYAIAECLHEREIKVSIVNPCLIKNFALSLGKRNKTDAIDCEVIAGFCAVNEPSLWEPPSKTVKELVELTRTIDDLKKQRQALRNRLEGRLSKVVEKSLLKVIQSLVTEIEELEKRASEIVCNDDDLNNKKKLMMSVPGIGEQTAQIILSETKGEPEKFDSSRTLVAYSGLSPSNRQSGISLNWSSLSKKGSSYFRSKLYFPTLSAIRNNPLIKKFYERLTGKGKAKMEAICACMGKLLKIVYGVLKSGKEFNPNYQDSAFSS
jgi:transposase